MDNIEVIDNFLEENIFSDIYNKIHDDSFPWFKSKNKYTVEKKDLKNKDDFKNMKEYMQFVHIFFTFDVLENIYVRSNHFYIIEGICSKLAKKYSDKEVLVERAKVNLQPQNSEFKEYNHNSPHIDLKNEKHKVILLYVDDSDGDTFFFNNENKIIKRVSPVKNRAVIFDGDILHAGSHPKNNDYRIVINMDFKLCSI